MIKLGILQLGFFALYIFTYKDFKLAAVKDYNIRKLEIMIAAMKNLKKIANKTSKTKLLHWEKRKEETQQQQLYLFHYTDRSYGIATVLQVIISKIEDGVRCKSSCLKISITILNQLTQIQNWFIPKIIETEILTESKLTFSQKLVIVNPKKFVKVRCT